MPQLRFRIVLDLPVEPGHEATTEAAKLFLMQLAAEIIRCAARINNTRG